jgi:hypothetical protein
MEHADTAQLVALLGAVGAGLALLARNRLTLAAGLAALALTEIGLAYSLGSVGGIDRVTSGAGAVAAVLGLGVLVAAASLAVRWPAYVPLATLLAAPFRPPLDFGGGHRFLVSIATDGRLGRLLPLYFVLAAAALALAWRSLRGERPVALPRLVALPAAAFFAVAFASLVWAKDVEAGANMLVFFTLPFAVLLAVVARAPYPAWLPRALGIGAIALGSVFAAIGLVQAITRTDFFYAPNLEVSNANTDYFRVTSLFGDPSLYGRHVVLAMSVVLVLLALRKVELRLGLSLLALMWAGLLFSYSQSSMAALVVVTLAIAAVTGDARVRKAVAVAAAVAVVAAVGVAAAKLVSGDSLRQISSDRTERVQDTTRVIAKHPLVGVGIGGQPAESRRLAHSTRPRENFVSHTTPLTVAAELGVVGLALYLWLLLGGARVVLEVSRLDRVLGLTLGAAFVALFVHALSYSGFLEDPLTWVVLAVGSGYLAQATRASPESKREPAAVPS